MFPVTCFSPATIFQLPSIVHFPHIGTTTTTNVKTIDITYSLFTLKFQDKNRCHYGLFPLVRHNNKHERSQIACSNKFQVMHKANKFMLVTIHCSMCVATTLFKVSPTLSLHCHHLHPNFPTHIGILHFPTSSGMHSAGALSMSHPSRKLGAHIGLALPGCCHSRVHAILPHIVAYMFQMHSAMWDPSCKWGVGFEPLACPVVAFLPFLPFLVARLLPFYLFAFLRSSRHYTSHFCLYVSNAQCKQSNIAANGPLIPLSPLVLKTENAAK